MEICEEGKILVEIFLGDVHQCVRMYVYVYIYVHEHICVCTSAQYMGTCLKKSLTSI